MNALLQQARFYGTRVSGLERDYKTERMRAMRERDEALVLAAQKGASIEELAEAALLSRMRVKQIIKDDRWR